jgi:hypothetical protein
MNKQFKIKVDENWDHDIKLPVFDTVFAHKASILADGQLRFSNQNNQLVKAYNASDWRTVEEIQEDPTPEQTGDTSISQVV